jgi:hypothetical protein
MSLKPKGSKETFLLLLASHYFKMKALLLGLEHQKKHHCPISSWHHHPLLLEMASKVVFLLQSLEQTLQLN